jgi:hypothetical protein
MEISADLRKLARSDRLLVREGEHFSELRPNAEQRGPVVALDG